jgi:hypothetical protein
VGNIDLTFIFHLLFLANLTPNGTLTGHGRLRIDSDQ